MTTTIVDDPRTSTLVEAFELLHGGDAAGEDKAREVAGHICWDGAADLVGDLPGRDPMDEGPLRSLLEDVVFDALDLLDLDDTALGEHIESEYGMRCADWNVVQSEREILRGNLHAAAARILAAQDALVMQQGFIARIGLSGLYFPAGI